MKQIYVVLTYLGYEDFQIHCAFNDIKKAEKFYSKLYKQLSKKEKEWNAQPGPNNNAHIRTIDFQP